MNIFLPPPFKFPLSNLSNFVSFFGKQKEQKISPSQIWQQQNTISIKNEKERISFFLKNLHFWRKQNQSTPQNLYLKVSHMGVSHIICELLRPRKHIFSFAKLWKPYIYFSPTCLEFNLNCRTSIWNVHYCFFPSFLYIFCPSKIQPTLKPPSTYTHVGIYTFLNASFKKFQNLTFFFLFMEIFDFLFGWCQISVFSF